VHIVVPFPPGGGADTLARIMEPKLAGIWAQPIVVENRPGASGHIGADFVAKSVPDGYTLLMSSTASLTEKNVKPVRAGVARFGFGLCRHREPGRRGGEHPGADRAREGEPGKLSFGSSGTGPPRISRRSFFKAMAGVDLLHVPYKGTGQGSPTCSPGT